MFRDARMSFVTEERKNEELTEEQMKLLEEIRDKFNPEEKTADLCILYEITNYKDLQIEDEEFWESYVDFDEIGLVRQDKMDIRALDYDQRHSY